MSDQNQVVDPGVSPTPDTNVADPTLNDTAPQPAGDGDGGTDPEPAPGKTDGDHEDELGPDGKPKKEGGFQKRIRKLSQAKSEAEAAAEYWRRKALGIEQVQAKPEATGAEKPKPRPDDFETLAEYLDARDAWVEERAARKALSEYEAKTKAESAKSEQERIAEKWEQHKNTGREKYEDFDEVIESYDGPITPAMSEALLTSEVGADLAYWLGKNPEKAAEIAKLSPIATARELGKIEARIAEQKSAAPKAAPTTRAPKPPTPVSKPSGSSAVDVNDPNVPYEDWLKARNAQLQRNR